MNSETDTIRFISSSQHQRQKQTNIIRQPQKEQMASWQPFPKKVATLYQNLTEYIFLTYIIVKRLFLDTFK